MKFKASVIGSPISHSLSPAIFSFVSRGNLPYDAREVKPDALGIFLSELRVNPQQIGLNVTLPLKEQILMELDEVAPEARSVGAVNVVHHDQNRLVGYNTDVIGIEKTLKKSSAKILNADCLIFGAGGSAKAVAYVLGKKGARQVWIYNPRSERGREWIASFNSQFPESRFHFVESRESLMGNALDLVVNTTPVGMISKKESDPDADQKFFSLLKDLEFNSEALAFDLIYTPEDTAFLKVARALGLNAVGGLGMLVDQALATWKIWFGDTPYASLSRQGLEDYLRGLLMLRERPSPIYLAGFMGVGKSVVAQEMAKITGRTYLDTDLWIENRVGMKVPEIFAQKGEAYFRELEREAVDAALHSSNAIISLGGGALMNPDCLRDLLAQGTLVFLSATTETLIQRLREEQKSYPRSRPLLDRDPAISLENKIESLLKVRLPIYERAQVQIPTDGLTVREVTEAILKKLGAHHEGY